MSSELAVGRKRKSEPHKVSPMLTTDPNSAHYPIDPNRLDLVAEFKRSPKGPHSPELQKVLHRMRWSGAIRVRPGC
jgi:hypothetical protein